MISLDGKDDNLVKSEMYNGLEKIPNLSHVIDDVSSHIDVYTHGDMISKENSSLGSSRLINFCTDAYY